TYTASENPEKESKTDRKARLKNKRNAKYRHYQTLEEGDGGPSTRTRSRTSKTSSNSKTKEGQRDRQRAHRASLKYCSLDEYQEEMKGEKPELCCMNGEVVLAPLQAPPPEIYYFLTEKDPISKVLFVDQIRAYNQAFAFTSIATDLDLTLPEQGEILKFSQIYFHDSSNIEVQIDRRHDHGKDMRQYNAPSAKEVAEICFSDETMHVRDILIIRHDNELERISELHGAYDPLAYPILFLCRRYASKISKAKAEASGTSNIDFGTLLERESQ
ncbi:25197_t:CDS:2, partial [Dentiscutata erythropus]